MKKYDWHCAENSTLPVCVVFEINDNDEQEDEICIVPIYRDDIETAERKSQWLVNILNEAYKVQEIEKTHDMEKR